jgi:hypothetical protein
VVGHFTPKRKVIVVSIHASEERSTTHKSELEKLLLWTQIDMGSIDTVAALYKQEINE